MRAILMAIMAGLALTLSHLAFAETDSAQGAKMERCFRAHGQMMDKPTVKNPRACWQAHGYLTETKR